MFEEGRKADGCGGHGPPPAGQWWISATQPDSHCPSLQLAVPFSLKEKKRRNKGQNQAPDSAAFLEMREEAGWVTSWPFRGPRRRQGG